MAETRRPRGLLRRRRPAGIDRTDRPSRVAAGRVSSPGCRTWNRCSPTSPPATVSRPGGGELAGFIDYRRSGPRLILVHTEVLPAFEGKGIASALARFVLDGIRERGERVSIRCPYLTAFVERHPEYAPGPDLRIPPLRRRPEASELADGPERWVRRGSGLDLLLFATLGGGARSCRAGQVRGRSVRTRRERPASVRTMAAGMTPPASDSTVAISPTYRPLRIRTRSPSPMDERPFTAERLIETVRPAGLRGSVAPRTGGAPFVAVLAGG